MRAFDATKVALTGATLVEASAGTGKTHAISTLFTRLVVEKGLPVNEILVVTFTESATLELRDRVRRRLAQALALLEGEGDASAAGDISWLLEDEGREARRRQVAVALQNVDEAAIFTIHGFCQRVLHDNAFESVMPFEVELMTDLAPMRDEVLQDFWAQETSAFHPLLLARLREAKLTPLGSRDLADKVCRDPSIAIVPRSPQTPGPFSADAHDEALGRVRGVWDLPRVAAAVERSQLDGRRYQARNIRTWLAKIDAFLSNRSSSIPRVELARFSNETLATHAKGRIASDPFFDALDGWSKERAKLDQALDAHVLWFKHRLVDYVRVELPKRKQDASVLSFDDLLLRLHGALAGPNGRSLAAAVRRRFPAALIDEFQDTDPVQYGIFEALYANTDACLFLIGDPKQAIYSFRGADVFAYLRGARATPEERQFTLGVNWRSDPSLVEAVNALFTNTDAPFLFADIYYPEVRPRSDAKDVLHLPPVLGRAPLQILVPRADEGGKRLSKERVATLPRAIAGHIAELLRAGGRIGDRAITAADVAVLTRTNDQAFEVQRELSRLSVPSVVLGDKSVFDTREAGELYRVLGALVEPTDSIALRAALTTELLGVTANQLAVAEEDESGWEGWVNEFRAWHRVWAERGFIQMFRALLTGRELMERLLSLNDGERRTTNLLHLMELLHTAAGQMHLGPAGLLHWFALAIDNREARPESAQIRLESDERAAKITTIHKSKGLEYPIVYCPYLWDGRMLFSHERQNHLFHDLADGDRLKLDLGLESTHLAEAETEKLAENLRLLYVALTRAKHRTVMVWGPIASFETSAFAHLLFGNEVAGEPQDRAEGLKKLLKERSEVELRSALSRLAATSPGAIEVHDFDLDAAGVPMARDADAGLSLGCREVKGHIDTWWRTASFSQIASAASTSRLDEAEGRDRDESIEPPAMAAHEPIAVADDLRLLGFPRGARAGNFFHDLLEHHDFASERPFALPELARVKLAEHGYPADLVDTVHQGVLDVLDTQLSAEVPARRLRNVGLRDRLNELEFHFPVAAGDEVEAPAKRIAQVTQLGLSETFRRHPSPEVLPEYAERLARLRFLPLRGYLKGYVDMVFAHEGQFFVVDYKTNHLGHALADYATARLPVAMAHSHYYLQYHLYTVAVHRYLARRVAGYDYDRHFGGVYYLFIRGMTPRSGPRTGVFFERPPRARIEALSQYLARPEHEGLA